MEKRYCKFCEKKIVDDYRQTHTREGIDFCNYECMSGFYGDEIPEDEDFVCV